jgi:hypothetical protein
VAKRIAAKPKAGTDDLEILHPELEVPVSGRLGVERWRVREMTLLEGFKWAATARAALEAAQGSQPRAGDLVKCIALCCGQDVLRVAGLPERDFQEVRAAWTRLNRAWLEVPEEETPRARRRGKPQRWSSIFQLLIAHGHHYREIGGYTLRQVELFAAEIYRAERRGRAARIADVNAGLAGGEAAKDTIRELDPPE